MGFLYEAEVDESEGEDDEVTGFIRFTGLDRDLDFNNNIDPGLF
jgi:hypothetical protein